MGHSLFKACRVDGSCPDAAYEKYTADSACEKYKAEILQRVRSDTEVIEPKIEPIVAKNSATITCRTSNVKTHDYIANIDVPIQPCAHTFEIYAYKAHLGAKITLDITWNGKRTRPYTFNCYGTSKHEIELSSDSTYWIKKNSTQCEDDAYSDKLQITLAYTGTTISIDIVPVNK
jgi:hypothetical protein